MHKISHLAVFFISIFLVSFQSFCQAPESVSIEGKTYFVYPHKLKFTPESDFKYALKKKYFKEVFYDFQTEKQDFDEKELKKIKKSIARQKRIFSQFLSISHQGYKYKNAIRKNYRPFFEPIYTLEEDIVPSLDSLPDGIYVQYYTDFIMGDSLGNILLAKNKIAGIFSIKNNLLHGKAAWFNFQGDTLKQGTYVNGVKEGEWKLKNYRFYEEYLSSYEKKLFIENNQSVDTLQWEVMYSNGLKNGRWFFSEKTAYSILLNNGYYTNNKASGTWTIKASRDDWNGYYKRDDLVTLQKFTYNSSDSISYQYLIRNSALDPHIYRDSFEFNSDYYNFPSYRMEYFDINFPIDENQKNKYNSYSYSARSYNNRESLLQTLSNKYIYDYGNKTSTYQQLTDQFGKKFLYEGTYESRYPNGQLIFHFNFKDNQLEKEDTLFWDNGVPMDIVASVPDSNQFTRSIYDYKGKLYIKSLYDAKGNFIRYIYDAEAEKEIKIENLPVETLFKILYIYQAKLDSATIFNSDTLLLTKGWNQIDTSIAFIQFFIPKDRKIIHTSYAVSGKILSQKETQFNSDYTLASNEYRTYYDDFCLRERNEMEFIGASPLDLISPKNYLVNFGNITFQEKKLLQNDIPYNGTIHFTDHLFAHNSSDIAQSIIKIPQYRLGKLERLYKKQKNTTEQKDKFEILDHTSLIRNDYKEQLKTVFLTSFTEKPVFYDYESDDEKSYYTGDIKFIDGEANGQWSLKHSKWKMTMEINFQKGNLNGPFVVLSTRENYKHTPDAFPAKAVRFENYVNDTLQGPAFNDEYHETKYTTYLNGEIHGTETKILDNSYFNVKQFKNGIEDGTYTAFRVNKDHDTTYFVKANFENGILTGNGVKYNSLGKIQYTFENNTFKQYDTLNLVVTEILLTNGIIASEKIFDHGLLDIEYQYYRKDSLTFKPSAFYSDINLSRLKEKLAEQQKKHHSKKYERYSRYYPSENKYEIETEDYYHSRDYNSKILIPKNYLGYRILKYYGNGQVAREGELYAADKIGNWKHYSYDGKLLYEINYADTILHLNDSISLPNYGVFTLYDTLGNKISQSYIIENFEKYDCSNNDHYTIRQFYTFWEKAGSNKINGYVKNYYDNGVLQSEGIMKNGLPEGIWKYYDPFGKLNQSGKYISGQKEGRWISGDLGKIKYLGDICFDPNTPEIEKLIKEREAELDIKISIFVHGKSLNNSFYEINKSGATSSGSTDEDSDYGERNFDGY